MQTFGVALDVLIKVHKISSITGNEEYHLATHALSALAPQPASRLDRSHRHASSKVNELSNLVKFEALVAEARMWQRVRMPICLPA